MNLIDAGLEAIRIQDIIRDMDGELTEDTEKALDAIFAAGKESLDAGAAVVRNLSADAETCRKEAQRLLDRAKGYDGNADALKGRMLFAVDAMGGKVKTEKNTIWGQTSAATISFDVAPDADLAKIAEQNSVFVRRRFELDKVELKRYYEAGETIPAAITVTENPGKRSLRLR